ncbi:MULTISPECIES: 1-phosphofructokinase family hexose kinase [Oerskovia]|uniref:1-phosphofructokinase family hexose kinase n=2 Tax=Oerskovia TaxID=162491 RepID=A0ABR8UYQ8_9CELL|nr:MULTISPECIES: PfkB family carbohydrate kinase [Oerskovia]MBD7997677.1 1-phosphofructokinase family hexose kinase [Oerskovia gallyi]MBM7496627.1 1-phosphofructokinase family hexose kinase [Oerskovia paurometabola]
MSGDQQVRVLCLTPNPAWDVTYGVDRLDPGEALRVRSVAARAGGKGVNVARVVRALGGDSVAVAPVGGLLGPAFAADLEAAGQPASLVPVAGALRQAVAVVPEHAGPDDGGHPTVLNEPGAPLTAQEWALFVRTAVGLVGDGTVVTISGSLPAGTTQDRFTDLVRSLRAAGCPVHVDASGPGLLWAARAGADLLKPNRAELAEATGETGLAEGVAALQGLGARDVVVTDGEKGLAAFEPGSTTPAARARLDVPVQGNPTGAGDAAMAALAVSAGRPWAERLALTVATSAAAVLQPVAGEVDPQDVRRLGARVLAENLIDTRTTED